MRLRLLLAFCAAGNVRESPRPAVGRWRSSGHRQAGVDVAMARRTRFERFSALGMAPARSFPLKLVIDSSIDALAERLLVELVELLSDELQVVAALVQVHA